MIFVVTLCNNNSSANDNLNFRLCKFEYSGTLIIRNLLSDMIFCYQNVLVSVRYIFVYIVFISFYSILYSILYSTYSIL